MANPKGRPKGSRDKITVQGLLAQLEHQGLPFEEALARNYAEAQTDRALRYKYDQLFLNKLLADQQQLEIRQSENIDAKEAAFLKAINLIKTVADGIKPDDKDQ
jgi:hypothetical protein